MQMRRMTYSVLATATALLHLAFILFVLFGGFLVLKWHKLAWIHVPAAVWGVLIVNLAIYVKVLR